MTKLSGVYTNPDGAIIPGARITLTLGGNTEKSFIKRTVEFTTGMDGSYSVELTAGGYYVDATYQGARRPERLGNIAITANSDDGTLNDYLILNNEPYDPVYDEIQQGLRDMEAIKNNPANVVQFEADIPGDPSGFYLVLNDEQKNAPTLYLYANGRRYWLAMVDDT
jgi:hypothetical protein